MNKLVYTDRIGNVTDIELYLAEPEHRELIYRLESNFYKVTRLSQDDIDRLIAEDKEEK